MWRCGPGLASSLYNMLGCYGESSSPAKAKALRNVREDKPMGWSTGNRNFVLVSIILMLVSTMTLGQDATGRIVGTVTDSAGAPILGANVTVTNLGTQISQNVSTTDNGYYQALSLP